MSASDIIEALDALREAVECGPLDDEGMCALRGLLRDETLRTLLERGEELERMADAASGLKLPEALDAAYQQARAGSGLERLLWEACEQVERTHDLEAKHDDLAAAVDMFLRDAPHVLHDPRRLRYALRDLAQAEQAVSESPNPLVIP